MRRSVVALSLVLTAALTALPNPVHAATAGSLKSITLSPSSTNLTIEPKVAANRDVTIINDGETPYVATLSVAPYRVQGEGYDPLFTRLPGTTDPSDWVKLSQTTVSLDAHKTAVIPYTVTAPSATAPGGYYAVIFAETANAPGSGVSARNRVGNILYIAVDGQVKQAGSVTPADTPSIMFGTTAQLGVKVTNEGGVHFQTDARFAVSGIGGNSLQDTTQTLYVLPQTTRHITQEFSPKGIGGVYKVSRSATVFGKQTTLPDAWIVIIKPQIIPLALFALLTLIGFILLLRRTKKPHSSKPRK